MANIMINSECNLRCTYCFVNDFNYNKGNNITLENFKIAVDFITADNNNEHIGIIGGEPTLHPQFDKILDYLADNEKVEKVIIFTNGILIDKFWDKIAHPKMKILVNCNNEDIIGRKNYSKLVANLKKAVSLKNLKEKIALGINLYKPDMDCTYIFELINMLKIDKLRLSVVVPNFKLDEEFDALQYYTTMKNVTLKVIIEALEMGITPYFDCNKMPLCVFDEEDRRKMLKISKKKISNVINLKSNCDPIIDILQDLTAIRCFGLSDILRVDISNFSNIVDIRNYFKYKIDDYSYLVKSSNQCQNCYNRIVKKCNSGCLTYKIEKIKKVIHKLNATL
ncbi:radical SAM protein [Clostridiaceae bacterium M8S5]|nr:radical SAM protein [Clostridiaceae bacterium M8S5]